MCIINKQLGIAYAYLTLVLVFGLSACQSTKSLTAREKGELRDLVESSPVFAESFTGFGLYNPENEQWLYQKDADKYFTPASNTKIVTLFAALAILRDSFPLLHYEKRGDSLMFWGSANPALLDPTLPLAPDAIGFLQAHEGPLFFAPTEFADQRFGAGWAWDDFPYYFQPEKSAMPLYGNVVHFAKGGADSVVKIWPAYFQEFTALDTSLNTLENSPRIIRPENENSFTLNSAAYEGATYQRWIPFRYQLETVLNLLRDTLDRNIYYLPNFKKENPKSLIAPRPDTVYRKLMQASDNFIAEQLLLMCSEQLSGEMNTQKAIQYTTQHLLGDLPDPLEWVDGSGLSRYNLFSPRSLVNILEKLYQTQSKDWLFSIFPSGGQDGTIESWYAPHAGEAPFIFAKTGTLRHRHCLSGYVLTRTGKTLIFSFMHNNFTNGSAPIKQEMDKVLRWIYNNL